MRQNTPQLMCHLINTPQHDQSNSKCALEKHSGIASRRVKPSSGCPIRRRYSMVFCSNIVIVQRLGSAASRCPSPSCAFNKLFDTLSDFRLVMSVTAAGSLWSKLSLKSRMVNWHRRAANAAGKYTRSSIFNFSSLRLGRAGRADSSGNISCTEMKVCLTHDQILKGTKPLIPEQFREVNDKRKVILWNCIAWTNPTHLECRIPISCKIPSVVVVRVTRNLYARQLC